MNIRKCSCCLLILSQLFILSCKNKKEHITDYFSKSEQLKHEFFYFSNSEEILNPVGMMIYDSLLFIQNLHCPFYFSLININQRRLIKHFGNAGEGPGEFIINLQIDKVKALNSINAPDMVQRRMYQYPIDSILKSQSPKPINLFDGISNKAADHTFHRILQINDSMFIGMGGYSGGRFTIFNIRNNKYSLTGTYPDKVQISDDFKGSAYQGYLGYNEYNQNIVFVSFDSEMLEFYHFEKNKIRIKKGYYTSIPKYDLKEEGNLKHIMSSLQGRHYISLTYTNEAVYVLYSQKDDSASIMAKCKGNCILVFDWNGKPIKKYQLDCEVKRIEINEDGSKIYALWDNPDPEIIYFDIDSKNQN
ncbi:MAG: BF3164 family lipoprotein [Bacteroidales bacterium]|nr:BF3164 family lipoprotein [Bacteroidales bacterium]